MSAESPLPPNSVVEINPMYLFRWEEPQQAHVLLYPEGIVKLNTTAAAVLELCSGERTVSDIVDLLKEQYAGERVADSATNFLEDAHDKGWIRVKS